MIFFVAQKGQLVEESSLVLIQQSGHLIEEEYQGKLNTYGNDSILFVKDCTQTNGGLL